MQTKLTKMILFLHSTIRPIIQDLFRQTFVVMFVFLLTKSSCFHRCYLNDKTENTTFVIFSITILEKSNCSVHSITPKYLAVDTGCSVFAGRRPRRKSAIFYRPASKSSKYRITNYLGLTLNVLYQNKTLLLLSVKLS